MDAALFCAQLRRRLRVILAADALSRLVRLWIVGLVVIAFLDFAAALPPLLRALAVLALVASGLWLLLLRAWRPLTRPMPDAAMASLAERRLPALNGLLLSRVDGVDLGADDQRRLENLLDADALCRLVRSDGLARRGSAAGLMVLAMLALVISNPGLASTAMARVLLPFGAAEWPRTTVHLAHFERSVVAEDEPLVAVIERPHGPPGPLLLQWRNARGSLEQRTSGALRGPWRELLPLAQGRHELVISGNDALPLTLHGSVVARPRALLQEVRVHPPAYTEAEVMRLSTLSSLAVLPGSLVEVDFILSQSPFAKESQWRVHFGDEALSDVTRDGELLRLRLPMMAAGTLAVDLSDYHRGQRYGEPTTIVIEGRPQAHYPIELMADRPPQVDLTGPRHAEAVTSRARVTLEISASDDYGLARLDLRARRLVASEDDEGESRAPGSAQLLAEEEQIIHRFEDVSGLRSTQRRHRLSLEGLVRRGDALELVAEAADANDISGPGIGRSRERLLRVVSEDELRQELDQALVEARDRLLQSRESLARGLAEPQALTDSARGAGSIGRRAADQLTEVIRRWGDNRQDSDRLAAMEQARGVVDDRALPALTGAAQGDDAAEAQARDADAALGEAAAMISALLQSDDLLRELEGLVRRQEGLGEEARQAVVQALIAPLSGAAAERAASMVGRQEELAAQLAAIERRILGSESSRHDAARALVERLQPADLLGRAARSLSGERPQQQGVRQQDDALAAMRRIRDALRGLDITSQAARDLRALADRQDQITDAIEAGEALAALVDEQGQLGREAAEQARILDEVDLSPEAASALQAALEAMGGAEQALQQGSRSQASRESTSAAALLRAVAEALAGGDDEGTSENGNDNEETESSGPDVLALIRRLVQQQTVVVTRATVLDLQAQRQHREAGGRGDYRDLDFNLSRSVRDLAQLQDDIRLQLEEEGLKELDQNPIAQRALSQVLVSMQQAYEHFAEPALGARGVRLPKIVLYQLQRLLAIAAAMPLPDSDAEEDNGGGDGDGGGGDRPAFPPTAEIALLRAEQMRLALLTRTRQPGDLGREQAELAGLVDYLLSGARPGSRAELLLRRSQRAMLSATHLLREQQSRGGLTQTEQDLAVASLNQLLSEAMQAGAASSGGQQQADSEGAGEREGQSRQSAADGVGTGDGEDQSQPGASQAGTQESGTVRAQVDDSRQGGLLDYATEVRPRLLEALNDESLPADARALLRRYFELMER